MPTETATTLAPGETKELPFPANRAPLEILAVGAEAGDGEFRIGSKTFSVPDGQTWQIQTKAMGTLTAENTGSVPLVITTRI